VARAGSFRGPALIVGVGTNAVTLAERLRDIGIFVHGPVTVPTAAAQLDEQGNPIVEEAPSPS